MPQTKTRNLRTIPLHGECDFCFFFIGVRPGNASAEGRKGTEGRHLEALTSVFPEDYLSRISLRARPAFFILQTSFYL